MQEGDSKWNHGCLSNGLAQLQSLLQHGSSTSHTPTDLYSCQMRGEASSFAMSSNELATMSALKSSFGKIHQPVLGGGINEWMKQFNQSASAYFQSTPAVEKPSCFTSTQNSYAIHHQLNSSKVLGNRMACSEARHWDSMQDSCDSRTYLDSIISQLPSITHQANFLSWYGDGSGSGNQMSVPSFSSESGGRGWPQQLGFQQSNFEGDLRPYPSFGGGSSYSNYPQPNTHLNNVMGECGSDLTANIMSQLQGKDAATLTSMLLQLVPQYPDLQKIDIHALAQALSEMNLQSTELAKIGSP